LREQAAEFRQGYRNDLSDPETVQRILDDQINILQGRGAAGTQRLATIGSGLDPQLLRSDQQEIIASAFEREANRKLDQERDAVDFLQKMVNLIEPGGLKVRLDDGAHVVRVVNEAPNSARVERLPSRADAANHYGT
jgi:hypothetical protein